MMAEINEPDRIALSNTKKKMYPRDSPNAPRAVSSGGRFCNARFTVTPNRIRKIRIEGMSSRPVSTSAMKAVRISAWNEIWKYRSMSCVPACWTGLLMKRGPCRLGWS